VIQPDGTILNLTQIGDEYLQWFETQEGYSVIKDSDNWWKYAAKGKTINDEHHNEEFISIEPTQFKVGKDDVISLNLSKGIRPKFIESQKNNKDRVTTLYTSGSGGPSMSNNYYDPVNGTQTIIAVLIQFTDLNGSRDAAYLTSKLFNQSPMSNSIYNYYKEVSLDQLYITGYVYPTWFNSSHNYSYYGANTGPNDPISDDNYVDNGYINIVVNPSALLYEVINLSDDQINYATYDTNSDCYVDHLMIIAAGYDERTNETYMNSKRAPAGPIITNDPCIVSGQNVMIRSYIVVSEETVYGSYAHEIGHDLTSWAHGPTGLPDLYDYTYFSRGIGVWDLMAYGDNPGAGRKPSHLSAYSKVMKGWVMPQLVNTSGEQSVLASENISNNNQKVYELAINNHEYFLIENRQKLGFDSDLPGNGLFIWHIDNSKEDNNNETFKMVDLEEADGNNTLDENTTNIGDSGDPWPYCSPCKRDFYNESDPNSNDYSNEDTGIAILNISDKQPVMTAVFIPSNYKGNTKVFGVYNLGDGTLNVSSITSNDTNHVSVSPSTFTVQPGEYKNVTVTIFGSFSPGENRYHITVNSNDAVNSPSTIPILVLKNSSIYEHYGISFSSLSPSILQINELDVLVSNGNNRLIEIVAQNNGGQQLTNLNWSLNTGAQTIYAQKLINLSSHQQAKIYVDYNYSGPGNYVVTASIFNASTNASSSINVTIQGNDVYIESLSVVKNSSRNVTYEFVLKNSLSQLVSNVSWKFKPNSSILINSTIPINLSSQGRAYVYIDYVYATSGNYTAVANVTYNGVTDTKNITINV
jgi:M6 family metalloprotease-like protein